VPGTPLSCDDNNACTVDACNPATGLCTNTGTCQPVCGNGIIEPGEQCDDGNNNDLDGCRNNCTLRAEVIPTLSEWAQLGLALILTAGAGWHLRRRRTLS
jgi:cysteine-rich repeat protein